MYLTLFFYPYNGGTENVLLEVYKRIARKHNITIITGTLKNRGKTTCEEIFGIKVVRLKSKYIYLPKAPLPYLRMCGIRDVIRKEKTDLYHINNRFQYGLGVVKEIKRNGAMALTIHNSLPRNIDLTTDTCGLIYDNIIGKKIIASADLITGVSEDAINVTVPKSALKRSYVVYNGVDYNLFRYRNKQNRNVKRVLHKLGFDGKIILNNGRLVPQKGQIYLLKALKLLLDKGYGVNVAIIGSGPGYAYLSKLSKNLGVENNVAFVGRVLQEDIKYYYNAADIFCLPSTYEPASIALLEGLASELPTVASRIGGIPEMMGKFGFYSIAKDERSIYNKIKFILNNKNRLGLMTKRGREKMIKEHDWKVISKRYEELFYSIIKY